MNDRPGLSIAAWFVFSAAVPLIHCASRLNLDLWHDEIYTIEYFVSRGPAFIVTDYSAPNNHVLYSLLVWPFCLISDSNFVLRLPSFLCTLGTLGFIFAVALRASGIVCAVLSTALVGLNQMFLIHSMQVRGYGLSMFFFAWLIWLAFEKNSRSRWRRLLEVALVGGAFLYVMPTNVLFFAPLATLSIGLSLGAAGGERLREILAWLSAALMALACYAPIAQQVMAASASASPSSWSALATLAGNFFRPATHDYIWFLPFFLAALAALCRPRGEPRRGWLLAIGGLALIAGALILTGLLRISPFERNYCPLLVPLALLAGWLLSQLVESGWTWIGKPSNADWSAAVSLALVSLILWPALWTYPQRLRARRQRADPANQWVSDGYYCYYAADYQPAAVVRYLFDSGLGNRSYRVCCTDEDMLNLLYYFARAGLPLNQSVTGISAASTLLAIAPQPPPWQKLAADRKLSEAQLRRFHLVDDFGFYRLYLAAEEKDR